MDCLCALWQEINDDKLSQENAHAKTIDAPLKPIFRAGTTAGGMDKLNDATWSLSPLRPSQRVETVKSKWCLSSADV